MFEAFGGGESASGITIRCGCNEPNEYDKLVGCSVKRGVATRQLPPPNTSNVKTYTTDDFKKWGAQGSKKRKRTRTITEAQQRKMQKARRKAKRSARLSNVSS